MIRNTVTTIRCLGTGALVAALGTATIPAGSFAGEAAAHAVQRVVHGRTMGTYFRISAAGTAAAQLETMEPDIVATLTGIERQMSTYRPDSALSRFNSSPARVWVAVPDALVQVITMARAVSEASGGAFDVTAGPLVNLWGFGPQERSPSHPSPAQLTDARRLVSFRCLSVRDAPPALQKNLEGMYVDLSGIAKGYAVDAVSRLLEDQGIRDYLVDIGGELRAAGLNGSGSPWTVAIETPGTDDGGNIRHIIRLGRGAVATSGDYRNYIERDRRRYPHIIDPRNGRPVQHGLASATVIADTAALADAYATAVLVLGLDEGLALLQRRGLHGLLLRRTSDGFQEHFTPGFHRFIATDL